MAHLLGAEQIDLEFPTKQVFDGITVGVNEGDRIGIVGRNGDGKSTLLKILSKQLEPDAGRVTWRGSLRIGYLTQVDKIDNSLSIAQAVVGEGPEHEWATDPKIRDVLQGLLGDLDWNQQVGSLSGGQRRRVALAALLAGMLLFAVFLFLIGTSPIEFYILVYKAGFGTSFSWTNTLARAAPLLLAALCVALPARLGLVVIGGEGAIVLGGVVGLEKAIKDAGFNVSVPFVGGRGDVDRQLDLLPARPVRPGATGECRGQGHHQHIPASQFHVVSTVVVVMIHPGFPVRLSMPRCGS
mgnify:CR=1 FL=1